MDADSLSCWNGQKVAPVHYIPCSIMYRHDCLPIPTGSGARTYSLVVHFAGSSILIQLLHLYEQSFQNKFCKSGKKLRRNIECELFQLYLDSGFQKMQCFLNYFMRAVLQLTAGIWNSHCRLGLQFLFCKINKNKSRARFEFDHEKTETKNSSRAFSF